MKFSLGTVAAAVAVSIAIAGCTGCGTNAGTNSGSQDSASAASAQSEQSSPKSLEIAESGYQISDSGYVHYGIKLRNPNTSIAATFPVVHITCKDASGAIVSSNDWTLGVVLPQEEAYYANQAGNGSVPEDAQVEFTVSVDQNKWKAATPKAAEPYAIDGLNRVDSTYRTSYTGQVTMNVDDQSYAKPMLVLILRDADGHIVYGTSTYLNSALTKGTPSAFEFGVYQAPEAASFEVHANPWM